MQAPLLTPGERAALTSVLADLVDGARSALGTNFVGAYLVGSFALGAGDRHSDVDFLDPATAGATSTTAAGTSSGTPTTTPR